MKYRGCAPALPEHTHKRSAKGATDADPLEYRKESILSDVFNALFATIESRRQEMPAGSYTTSLFEAGEPEICKKIGEEAVEVAVAALAEGDERVLYEMADMTYHSLVLLSARGLALNDLERELQARFHTDHE